MMIAQNRIKMQADKNCPNKEFSMGDKVLLKLQLYIQSCVANRPFPNLAYKYFGPHTILERIGSVTYKLELREDSPIHHIFHISQLKSYHQYHSPLFSNLPMLTVTQASTAQPLKVLNTCLGKKGNTAMPQVLLSWIGLPTSSTTWEGYYVVKKRFLNAPTQGQASSSVGELSQSKSNGPDSKCQVMKTRPRQGVFPINVIKQTLACGSMGPVVGCLKYSNYCCKDIIGVYYSQQTHESQGFPLCFLSLAKLQQV